jgi:hypothetical protein
MALNGQGMGYIDDALVCDTPMTTITESAYTVPHHGRSWQQEDPKSWSVQQVSVWMQDSGMETETIDTFAINDIDGSVLMDLKVEDLKELGIESFGKRKQVWNHIALLKESREAQHGPKRKSGGSHARRGSCESITPTDEQGSLPNGHGVRRRREFRSNGYEPIAPADSISIVAIEQYLPKPHWCTKGDACEKTRMQKRLLKRLEKENGFPISPGESGGKIVMVGNVNPKGPANNHLAPPLNPHIPLHYQNHHDERLSDTDPSVVGPSVVASSDLLGPGELPEFAMLDPARLREIGERDPQDNVKTFLALQSMEPPQTIASPYDPESPDFDDEHTSPIFPQNPVFTQPTLTTLSLLPRLQIPGMNSSTSSIEKLSKTPIVPQEELSSPLIKTVDNIYRYGTPASDMDVPITQPNIGQPARETSQSVPPNMQYRDQTQVSHTPTSAHPHNWKRPSFMLPVLAEGEVFQPSIHAPEVNTKPEVVPAPSARSSFTSAGSSTPASRTGSVSTSATTTDSQSVTKPVELVALKRASTDSLLSSTSGSAPAIDQRYVSTGSNVTHSGWMKKRKTKLLRHEWHERHFRLTDQAQLSMHKNDLAASSPLDVLNIDEYVVACSSIGTGTKLAARLKALRLNGNSGEKEEDPKDVGKDTATHAKDAAFSFQLVPKDSSASGSSSSKLMKKAMATSGSEKKTHHFAVKSRDDRIDWMRELMLAKTMREKQGSGHEVELVRVEPKTAFTSQNEFKLEVAPQEKA